MWPSSGDEDGKERGSLRGGDDEARPEDRLADELSAFDESLAAGSEAAPVPGESADDPELNSAQAFLWLLERAWPRDKPGGPPDGAPEVSPPTEPGARDGSRFGRFHVVRALGQGGYGIVLLAWDPKLRRPVAL